ncbi:unnamed protein product [Triticum turgidum subsp. durum]|uniref:Uncharacterized protein n=1 Tax=Triticum turgidum subsp. durum TaxID=4567 RepID=A0A9R0W5Q7_TRITD|nr:unnamed protein product [Triticum turgidum subsp. durum]
MMPAALLSPLAAENPRLLIDVLGLNWTIRKLDGGALCTHKISQERVAKLWSVFTLQEGARKRVTPIL